MKNIFKIYEKEKNWIYNFYVAFFIVGCFSCYLLIFDFVKSGFFNTLVWWIPTDPAELIIKGILITGLIIFIKVIWNNFLE